MIFAIINAALLDYISRDREEKKLPTLEQGRMTIIICQSLSDLLQDIVLLRYNKTTKEVYILASNSLQIKILANGKWEFISE